MISMQLWGSPSSSVDSSYSKIVNRESFECNVWYSLVSGPFYMCVCLSGDKGECIMWNHDCEWESRTVTTDLLIENIAAATVFCLEEKISNISVRNVIILSENRL